MRNIDLASELPLDRFAISITREVEIETSAIPAERTALKDYPAFKEYIAQTIHDCQIKTTWVFGFAAEGPGPQRLGGFDQGVWQSRTESEFYAAIREQYLIGRPEKNSQLTGNEADAAVAAQSFFSIVLTCESPNKSGPLKFAADHGGKILNLSGFDQSGFTPRAYIEDFYQRT
jgi:hypothetical protein